MLPLIKIDYNEVCQTVEDYMKPGSFKTVVQSYAFRIDELASSLNEDNENIDQSLSKIISMGVMQKQVKSKMLFFFSPFSELMFVSVATYKLNTNLDWLRHIPGYSESGQDYLNQNAKAFMYWDGDNLMRIYEIPEYDPDKYYINDFGSLYGLTSSETDLENYNDINENEYNEYWDYSVVPKIPEEIISYKIKKYVLLHNRYLFINNN